MKTSVVWSIRSFRESPPALRRVACVAAWSGLFLACILGIFHDLTAATWSNFARQPFVRENPLFLWPLDTRSTGVDAELEHLPGGEALRAFAPASRFRFSTFRPMDLELTYALDNTEIDQEVTVLVNGRVSAVYRSMPRGPLGTPEEPQTITFRSLAGANSVDFVYGRPGRLLATGDPGPLAVRFTRLRLFPVLPREGGE